MLTEPKTALAGVTLESSFARFKASMAAFNVETTPSRSFSRRDLVSMIVEVAARELGGAEAVRKAPNPSRDERPSCHGTPREANCNSWS